MAGEEEGAWDLEGTSVLNPATALLARLALSGQRREMHAKAPLPLSGAGGAEAAYKEPG